MKLTDLIDINENELPLDQIVSDGGYCSIFQTIACIGDSLSSGEFEAVDQNDNRTFHDLFDYSWGQFIARHAGVKVFNFSRGGMTAKEYMESFGEANNYFDESKKAKAYIIALGINDLLGQKQELGTIADIDLDNLNNNKDTFAGWYGRVIQTYKNIEPNARFFLVTMAKEEKEDEHIRIAHQQLLYEMTKIFSNSYVIDLFKYAPLYDKQFKEKFFLHGHMNPAGYKLTAYMISSYIDYIVRHDFSSFKQVGFIGHPQYDDSMDK